MTNTAAAASRLRVDVRELLGSYEFEPSCDAWMRKPDPAFSRELGRRGWIGMTLPHRYGGGERSFVDRLVVTEELIRAGAPVAAHWIADRQIAPTVLRYGTERLKQEILPGICRGELYVCAGISEPDTGSDVASVRTKATRSGSGWILSGHKVWTTLAHQAHFIYVLARTGDEAEDRHAGLSEFVIPVDTPGISISPIPDSSGEHHFNEVVLHGVEVSGWRLLGEAGMAWLQIVRQLDYERGGPERFLTTFPAFEAIAEAAEATGPVSSVVGSIVAEYSVLRMMSRSIAVGTDRRSPPGAIAAMAKDLGTRLEQRIGTVALDVHHSEIPGLATDPRNDASGARFAQSIVYSPAFTLRGGTNEILRTIVARRYLATQGRASGKGRPDAASAQLLRADPELRILSESARSVLASSTSPDDILQQGGALGWFSSFVPVDHGGEGDPPTFRYLATILRAQGRAGIDVPIAEQAVGCYMLAAAGESALAADAMQGHLRVGIVVSGTRYGDAGYPDRIMTTSGLSAADVVVAADGKGGMSIVEPTDVTYRASVNLAGDPRETGQADTRAAEDGRRSTTDPVAGLAVELLTVCRASQVVGALEEITRLSTDYAESREQFGRPISQFQAVSHMLATMAEYQVAAGIALERLGGSGLGEAWARGAAAVKYWTCCSARTAYRLAHQVHGAIGVTEEYPLHRLTLRALAWSEEYGGRAAWSARLGSEVASYGIDAWWDSISEIVDG